MKKPIAILCTALAVLLIFLLMGPLFVLNEGTQAVVTRFGEIVAAQSNAGLHWKMPFIDTVHEYPKRILALDGDPQRIPTKENQFIIVDTTSRWCISDPQKFYEAVRTVETANIRLSNIIDSATRTIITSNSLNEVVRNSNLINELQHSEMFALGAETEDIEIEGFTTSKTVFESVSKGRTKLSKEMADLARNMVHEYGIELIDVVPRQIKYSNELTESVYNRMIKERNQIAQMFRSSGEGQKARWLGKQENEKRAVISEAYARAEKIKAEADAEATKIYAEAYSKDPDFYAFWKSIESYKTTMPKFDKTLSTGMDYFKYLYTPNGRSR